MITPSDLLKHTDKGLHVVLTVVVVLAFSGLGFNWWRCGLLTFLSASLFKEFFWDGCLGRGTFSWGDILANLIGSVLGALIVWII